MIIQFNKANVLDGINWFQKGWILFKKAPITLVFMTLVFSLFYLVGLNTVVGQYIVALLAPVLAGGVFLAIDKTYRGDKIHFEDLFAVFKDKNLLKQCLVIGAIGMGVVTLTLIFQNMPTSDHMMRSIGGDSRNVYDGTPFSLGSFLTKLLSWIWTISLLFGVALVAIKRVEAIPALKSSIAAVLSNFFPLVIFYLIAFILTFIAVLPFGLGLLILMPIVLCSNYCLFRTIYLESDN